MIPAARRASGSTSRCVRPAGCSMSESVQPRLTAGVTRRTARMTRAAVS